MQHPGSVLMCGAGRISTTQNPELQEGLGQARSAFLVPASPHLPVDSVDSTGHREMQPRTWRTTRPPTMYKDLPKSTIQELFHLPSFDSILPEGTLHGEAGMSHVCDGGRPNVHARTTQHIDIQLLSPSMPGINGTCACMHARACIPPSPMVKRRATRRAMHWCHTRHLI